MTEQRERLERALRGCAEQGVPDTTDLWPGIEERVVVPPRRSRRLVPRTRAGWVFAALMVLLFSTGAYAASGWVNELFDYTVPEIEKGNFGVLINQTQSVDGITFTLEKAYADEANVVVGYSIRGFENRAHVRPTSGPPVMKDEGGTAFEYIGGLGMVTDPMDRSIDEGDSTDLAFFEPSEKLTSSGKHRFRFELKYVPPEKGDRRSDGYENPATKTLVFDFSVPVREIEVIEVGETAKANGIEMTMSRVENSPARTQAFLCFDPPRDERYNWVPVVERPDIAESDVFSNESLYYTKPEEATGCVGYDLFRSLYEQPGSHSLTVERIEGRSQVKVHPDETIHGPWTFDFEIPER